VKKVPVVTVLEIVGHLELKDVVHRFTSSEINSNI
jgi:hypothetical protein